MKTFYIRNKLSHLTELEIRTFSPARAIYNALISQNITTAEFYDQYEVV